MVKYAGSFQPCGNLNSFFGRSQGLSQDHVPTGTSWPKGELKLNAMTKEKEPEMTQKVEAIEKLGFGVMNKIFLAFDKIFWDQVSKELAELST